MKLTNADQIGLFIFLIDIYW